MKKLNILLCVVLVFMLSACSVSKTQSVSDGSDAKIKKASYTKLVSNESDAKIKQNSDTKPVSNESNTKIKKASYTKPVSNGNNANTEQASVSSDNRIFSEDDVSQYEIPFQVDESILGDPPTGALSVFEAQELLNSQILTYEGSQMLQCPNLSYIYRGIEYQDGRDFYCIDLCSSMEGGEARTMSSYQVGIYGSILLFDQDSGEWSQMRSGDGKPEEYTEELPEVTTGVLYTNMEVGSATAQFQEDPFEYTGSFKTGEEWAELLSKRTGLNFSVTLISKAKAGSNTEGVLVIWEDDSTLITGLLNSEQKEDFRFYDEESMRWFMMDSLWKTLTENLDVENVYYTMASDNKLVFDELYPIKEFPEDLPYMGSKFYFAHAGDKGDE